MAQPGHGLGIVDTEGAVERKPFVDEQPASFPGFEQGPVFDRVTVSQCRGCVPLAGVGGCEGGAQPGPLAYRESRLHPCGEALGVGSASGEAERHDRLDGDVHRSAVRGGKTLQGGCQQLNLAAEMDGLVGCGEQCLDRGVVGCPRRPLDVVSDLERRRAGGGQHAGGFEVQRLTYRGPHVVGEGGPQQVVSERQSTAIVDQDAGSGGIVEDRQQVAHRGAADARQVGR